MSGAFIAPRASRAIAFEFRKKAIFGGRAEVRAVLYMAALPAQRCNSVIKALAERLKQAMPLGTRGQRDVSYMRSTRERLMAIGS
jgi:hypothetical protein